MQSGGGWKRRRPGGEQPVDGRLAGLGVDAAVIDGLDPCGEQPVESGQVVRRSRLDLDKELDAHRLEDPFDFPSALRPTWATVHEAHTEARAGPQQLLGRVRRAVIDVAAARHTTRRERSTERRLETDRVLREPPPIADQGAAVVVDEREQVGLAASDHRSVQGVAGPQIARCGGLETAEGLRRRPVGAGVEPEPGEVALHGALRRP